jgi:hypothetical protein
MKSMVNLSTTVRWMRPAVFSTRTTAMVAQWHPASGPDFWKGRVQINQNDNHFAQKGHGEMVAKRHIDNRMVGQGYSEILLLLVPVPATGGGVFLHFKKVTLQCEYNEAMMRRFAIAFTN